MRELPKFRVGDEVKLSEIGKSRLPRMKNITGKVVKLPRSSYSIDVLFDGNTASTRVHRTYIEINRT
jgi:hypothetical protein